MSMPISAATSAYGQAQKLIDQSSGLSKAVAPENVTGPDFSQILAQNLQSVVETGQSSDQATLDMINGKADIVDVVTAIAETEIAIESMVAVRDRIIQAYEEIMRMPI